jgi:hypothetical protein
MIAKKYFYTYIRPDTNVYFISSKLSHQEHKKYSMKGQIYSEPYWNNENEAVNAVIAYSNYEQCVQKMNILELENKDCEVRDMKIIDIQTYCNELRMPLNVIINSFCNIDDKIEYNEIYFYKYKRDDEYMNFEKYKRLL